MKGKNRIFCLTLVSAFHILKVAESGDLGGMTMTLKRTLRLWAVLCMLAVGLIAGPLTGGIFGPAAAEGQPVRVVATIFPIYDWAREILAGCEERVDLTLLTDNGVDLHSYQPSARDIMNISTADLLIYVGGESDDWVREAASDAMNRDQTALSLVDLLGDNVRAEEVVEGMQAEEAFEPDEAPDEHVWLSLRNAKKAVQAIAEALAALDPADEDTFRTHAAAYADALDALDARYTEATAHAENHTLLFGDRFPFRYLTEDYGLDYYAAFPGCSAESEASFQTIVFLAQKMDELGLPAVMTIDGQNRRIAESIVQNTAARDVKILSLDSMQSVTAEEIRAGITYLGVMEGNLAILEEALNQ